MTNKTSEPTTNLDKQLTPLKGEVTLEDARFKAYTYAVKIKDRLNSKGAKLK